MANCFAVGAVSGVAQPFAPAGQPEGVQGCNPQVRFANLLPIQRVSRWIAASFPHFFSHKRNGPGVGRGGPQRSTSGHCPRIWGR